MLLGLAEKPAWQVKRTEHTTKTNGTDEQHSVEIKFISHSLGFSGVFGNRSMLDNFETKCVHMWRHSVPPPVYLNGICIDLRLVAGALTGGA